MEFLKHEQTKLINSFDFNYSIIEGKFNLITFFKVDQVKEV
jgi:hypothetical protein